MPNTLEEKKEGNTCRDAVRDCIEHATEGSIIRPAEIAGLADMTVVEVYQTIEDQYAKQGIVYPVIELRCPYCRQLTGKFVRTFPEIPMKTACPHCGKTCRSFTKISNNAFVVYQKAAAPKDKE